MRFDRRVGLVLLALSAPLGAGAGGCVSDDNAAPPAAGDDASLGGDTNLPPTPDGGGADTTVPDGSTLDTSTPDSGPAPDAADASLPTGQIRVAYFADPQVLLSAAFRMRGVGPEELSTTTYDACIAPHGTGQWQGPLLTKAGSPGLSLYDVTRYFPVPPGQYDVRVVIIPGGEDAGTPSCALEANLDAAAPATDFTNLPAVAAGAQLTAVVTPDLNPEGPEPNRLNLGLVTLVDESTVSAGNVKVRFANVAGYTNTDPLSFGLGGGAIFTPIIADVASSTIVWEPADAGADSGDAGPAATDSNGYAEIAPFTQIDTSLMDTNYGPPGQPIVADLGWSGAIDAPAGTILSAFAVAKSFGAANSWGAGLVVCFDGQTDSTNPLLTKCSPFSINQPQNIPTPGVRFGNFIADATPPTFDVCAKYAVQTAFTKINAASDTIPFGGMSARYDLHAGFSFDLRLVTAGADCSTPLVPDSIYTPPASPAQGATVVVTGYTQPPDDAGDPPVVDAGVDAGAGLATTALTTVVLADVACLEGFPVVRVVNVDAANPVPVQVTFDGQDDDTWTATEVYGGYLGPAPLDACGYQPVTAETGNMTVTTGFNGGPVTNNAYQYTVSSTTQDTLYMFGSAQSFGVQVLDCQDQPGAIGCSGLQSAD